MLAAEALAPLQAPATPRVLAPLLALAPQVPAPGRAAALRAPAWAGTELALAVSPLVEEPRDRREDAHREASRPASAHAPQACPGRASLDAEAWALQAGAASRRGAWAPVVCGRDLAAPRGEPNPREAAHPKAPCAAWLQGGKGPVAEGDRRQAEPPQGGAPAGAEGEQRGAAQRRMAQGQVARP